LIDIQETYGAQMQRDVEGQAGTSAKALVGATLLALLT
jgi:hypothetical protein